AQSQVTAQQQTVRNPNPLGDGTTSQDKNASPFTTSPNTRAPPADPFASQQVEQQAHQHPTSSQQIGRPGFLGLQPIPVSENQLRELAPGLMSTFVPTKNDPDRDLQAARASPAPLEDDINTRDLQQNRSDKNRTMLHLPATRGPKGNYKPSAGSLGPSPPIPIPRWNSSEWIFGTNRSVVSWP
ncbi:unnamed protein product, partial [Amoebophrya sp. A120]